jgi:hypothetical protein
VCVCVCELWIFYTEDRYSIIYDTTVPTYQSIGRLTSQNTLICFPSCRFTTKIQYVFLISTCVPSASPKFILIYLFTLRIFITVYTILASDSSPHSDSNALSHITAYSQSGESRLFCSPHKTVETTKHWDDQKSQYKAIEIVKNMNLAYCYRRRGRMFPIVIIVIIMQGVAYYNLSLVCAGTCCSKTLQHIKCTML